MKVLSILGSTGSIGRSTLKIAEKFPRLFTVKTLTAKTNIELLSKQIHFFRPELVAVFDQKHAEALKKLLPQSSSCKIVYGSKGYLEAAVYEKVDMVVAAMVGAAGLLPTLGAIEAGKDIALANKETLVMAGEIVMERAFQKKIKILPVDSEHSAIFQCLMGQRKEDLSKILLTASGGPFLNTPANAFSEITVQKALKHPTWQMGKKISIDSATLMNKGLEVIEARHLFDVSEKKIEVIIHPQSVIHSMVSYKDGAVIAQLGIPDMKGAIAFALSFPYRLDLNQASPDFSRIGSLTFNEPDYQKFPCLALAYKACAAGGTLPAVLNAANEIAVAAFLENKLSFTGIPEIIEKTMEQHTLINGPTLDDILESDKWARQTAFEKIKSFND